MLPAAPVTTTLIGFLAKATGAEWISAGEVDAAGDRWPSTDDRRRADDMGNGREGGGDDAGATNGTLAAADVVFGVSAADDVTPKAQTEETQ